MLASLKFQERGRERKVDERRLGREILKDGQYSTKGDGNEERWNEKESVGRKGPQEN